MFGAELGRVFIEVRANMDKLGSDFSKATRQAATSLGGLSTKMTRTGEAMTRSFTPVAAGVGAAMLGAFTDFDTGADALTARAGLMGQELEDAISGMKDLGGEVAVPLAQIGTVMADVAAATKMTGEPLEELTGQILKLGELGQQLDALQVQRFIGDWGIAAENVAGSLDRLLRISQETGVGMGRLMYLAAQFGAPLRSLGYDVEEVTLLLAKWEQEGVNTEAVLAGMKVGLGGIAQGMGASEEQVIKSEDAQNKYNDALAEFGADSLEARDAALALDTANADLARTVGDIPGQFKTALDAIASATTEAGAFAVAIEYFGRRAGPDMAKAVLEGRFEVDALAEALGDTTGAIDETYDATLDWSDKLEMLKNKVVAVIGPVGEVGAALGGLGAGIGPALQMGGALIRMFTGAGGAAAAATPLVAAQGVAAGTAGGLAAAGSGGFFAFAAALWASIAPVLAVIAIIAALIAAGYLLVKHWDTVTGAAAAAWGAIKDIVGGAIGWITDNLDLLAVVFFGFPALVAHGVLAGWNGMISTLKAAWNSFARFINNIEFRFGGYDIPGPGPNIPGFTVGLPNLPTFASGGAIAEAGMAVVGERGAETVWLPAGAAVQAHGTGSSPGAAGGGTTVLNLNAKALLGTKQDVIRWVREALKGVDYRSGAD